MIFRRKHNIKIPKEVIPGEMFFILEGEVFHAKINTLLIFSDEIRAKTSDPVASLGKVNTFFELRRLLKI